MPLVKVKYYWRGEENLWLIELTPDQEEFVLRYCKDFNSLFDYLKTIRPWEIVPDSVRG